MCEVHIEPFSTFESGLFISLYTGGSNSVCLGGIEFYKENPCEYLGLETARTNFDGLAMRARKCR